MNEDEFLELIRTREGELDEKQKKALAKAEEKIIEDAKELVRREQEEEALRKRKDAALNGTGIPAKWVLVASPADRQESGASIITALDDKVRAHECQRDLWE